MKQVFPKAFLALISVLAWQAGALNAEPTNSPLMECSKELLLSYFPEPFVKETLEKNQIPKEKWDSIVKDLAASNSQVITKVEARAKEMSPNPLKSPEYREQAIKIFRDTLLEVFTEAMNKNGINDSEQIQTMLDDVQHLKAKRFAQCMSQTRKQLDEKVNP